MANQKFSFEDFITTVEDEQSEFVTKLHQMLTQGGCKIEVKESKSGYLVSYILNKKTIANYVFRKKGLIVRIYANHITEYMEILDGFSDEMIKSIEDAPICKRLVNPESCNSKCAMGYDFILKGERYQKCRSNAFMFMFCEENNPFIEDFLKREMQACL